MGPTLKSGLHTQWDSLGENYFLFVNGFQLEIVSVLGMRTCVHFFSQCWDPSWPRPMHTLCMLRQFLWVQIESGPPGFRKPCFYGVLAPLWLLQYFCLLFHKVSGTWAWKLMETLMASFKTYILSSFCYSSQIFPWWFYSISILSTLGGYRSRTVWQKTFPQIPLFLSTVTGQV